VAQLFETKLVRDQFRERLDRVQKADEIIAAAESFLAGCNLDDSKLAEIDDAANSLAVAEGRAAAGRPQLALEALAPIDVVIDGTSHEVRPGTPLAVAVAGRLEAVIADVARITISGPDAHADADAALTDSQRDLDGLLRAAGVSSPAEARQLARARSAQLQELNNARQRRAADLSDLDPPQLAAKLGRAQERLDALDAGIDPTAPGVATIDDARSLAAAAHSRVEQARALHDRRRTEVEAAEGALRLLQDKRIEDRTRLQAASEDARRYADELQVQRRDAADDAVNEAVEQAQATLQAAQQEHRGAAQKLAAADPATARAALENAQALQKRLDHDIRALELERATTGAQLEAEGHDGLAGRLADTQARLEDLRREIESEDRRAAAVAHLHAVLTAKRYAAKQAYIGPYSDKINAYARILYGSDVVVNVDTGTFEITSRTLNGRTEAFHRLSGGAREQLAVIARLACGALVSPSTGGDTDGGVPVLIDDALGYSDPDKLAKIGAAFTVAGRECQVIVLTCEPSRYRGVGAARVVSLG
jgi:hypothetical protein